MYQAPAERESAAKGQGGITSGSAKGFPDRSAPVHPVNGNAELAKYLPEMG